MLVDSVCCRIVFGEDRGVVAKIAIACPMADLIVNAFTCGSEDEGGRACEAVC